MRKKPIMLRVSDLRTDVHSELKKQLSCLKSLNGEAGAGA